MFNNYESRFHLDLWENCENEIADFPIKKERFYSFEGIKGALALINRSLFLKESFEFEGKVYDNFEDVYHVGSFVEYVHSIKQLEKIISPGYIKNTYPNDKDYPVDFFIQFVDPVSLKRIGLMIVYESNPFEDNKYDKKTGRIIVFKAKAFATRRHGASWRFEFMINNKSDIIKAKNDPDLKISWSYEPRKTIYDLSPRAIQKNVYSVVSKLNSYKIAGDEVLEVIKGIIDATR